MISSRCIRNRVDGKIKAFLFEYYLRPLFDRQVSPFKPQMEIKMKEDAAGIQNNLLHRNKIHNQYNAFKAEEQMLNSAYNINISLKKHISISLF